MSMYEFIDIVTGATGSTGASLPTEAVKINGKYLEDILPGYRTLYVAGRESLEKEINAISVGSADGSTVLGSRYPTRTLTIGFQLIASDPQEFRERFTNLNNLLSQEDADIVFADEPDKFFTGTPIMNASVSPGRNAVTGEWNLLCSYPFKRSCALTTLSSTDEAGVEVGASSATFTFNYKGTVPARPILRAQFAAAKSGGDYTEDGDCGYVAFLDDEENIIQLGNPDIVEMDPDDPNANGTIFNSKFTETTGWTVDDMVIGNITDQYYDDGTGQTLSFAKRNSAEASLTRPLSGNGVVNFDMNLLHRLCVNGTGETGTFEVLGINDTTGKIIVGFKITKVGAGTAGVVQYIIDNKVVGTDSIDLSLYNTNFGYTLRTAIMGTQVYYETKTRTVTKKGKKKKKKKGKKGNKKTVKVKKTREVVTGYRYTTPNLNTTVSRDDTVVTFNVGNCPERTFKASAIIGIAVTSVALNFTGNFHTNAIHSIDMIGKAGAPFSEIPNVFTAEDVVEADCNDASVSLYRAGSIEGRQAPQYGALGNDWEDFEIKPGQNVIRAVWSEWVNPSYKPLIQIIFNEVDI